MDEFSRFLTLKLPSVCHDATTFYGIKSKELIYSQYTNWIITV